MRSRASHEFHPARKNSLHRPASPSRSTFAHALAQQDPDSNREDREIEKEESRYELPINTPARNTRMPPTITWTVESQKFMRKYRYRMKAIVTSSTPTTK